MVKKSALVVLSCIVVKKISRVPQGGKAPHPFLLLFFYLIWQRR
jgi:hypothetical protein